MSCVCLSDLVSQHPALLLGLAATIGLSSIKQAAILQKGGRFLEELLLASITVEEQSTLENWKPDTIVEAQPVEIKETNESKYTGIF